MGFFKLHFNTLSLTLFSELLYFTILASVLPGRKGDHTGRSTQCLEITEETAEIGDNRNT